MKQNKVNVIMFRCSDFKTLDFYFCLIYLNSILKIFIGKTAIKKCEEKSMSS